MVNGFTEIKKTPKCENTLSDHDRIHRHRNLNYTERSVIARRRNFNAPKICKITVQPGAMKIGSLMSLDACNSGASSDVREPISLHRAVYRWALETSKCKNEAKKERKKFLFPSLFCASPIEWFDRRQKDNKNGSTEDRKDYKNGSSCV